MNIIGRDVAHGSENKATEMHAGVGKSEGRGIDDEVAKEDKVDVDRAGGVGAEDAG
jgi:hypothetical protein